MSHPELLILLANPTLDGSALAALRIFVGVGGRLKAALAAFSLPPTPQYSRARSGEIAGFARSIERLQTCAKPGAERAQR